MTAGNSASSLSQRVRHALESADLAEIAELLDPEVTWGPPGDSKWGCHNKDQVLSWYGRGRESGVRAEVTEVLEAESKILVGLLLRGRDEVDGGGGAHRWQVLSVRRGHISDIRGYEVRSEALAAAGLTTGS